MNEHSNQQSDNENQSDYQQQFAELNRIYENIPIGLLVIDRNLRFVRINKFIAELDGKSVEEHVGHTLEEVFPGLAEQLTGILKPIFDNGEPVLNVEISGITPKAPGTIRHWLANFSPLKSEAGEIVEVLGTLTEITERKQVEAVLHESSEILRLVLDTIPVSVWWKDRNGVYLGTNYLNAVNAGLLSPEEMIGKTDFEMPWKDTDAEKYRTDDQEVMKTGVPKLNYEESLYTSEGSTIWIRTSKVPLRNTDGDVIGVLGTFEDITEHKQSEEALRKANRTLAALSRVNEILVRATEESELLRDVCQAIVDAGEYRMAWVGFAEDDEAKTVRPVAHAGYESGYLDQVKISWADNELGQGPAGTTIRTGKLSVVNDIRTEPSYRPWREEAIKREYACSISLPLTTSGKVIGSLNLYRTEPGCLDPSEEQLLFQLVSDLSYGITSLRVNNLQRAAEAERRAFEQQLDEHKRKFYRETILSVTEGKLNVCETTSVKPYLSNTQIKIDANKASEVGQARKEVELFCISQGLSGDKLSDFMVGVGEAITNALKHGHRGCVYAGKTGDEVWVGVKDHGPGIESLILPRAVLRRGFSTKPSLGLGYSIMLDVADRILLNTGAHGTTIILIKSLIENAAVSLVTIPDTWEGIPDNIS